MPQRKWIRMNQLIPLVQVIAMKMTTTCPLWMLILSKIELWPKLLTKRRLSRSLIKSSHAPAARAWIPSSVISTITMSTNLDTSARIAIGTGPQVAQ